MGFLILDTRFDFGYTVSLRCWTFTLSKNGKNKKKGIYLRQIFFMRFKCYHAFLFVLVLNFFSSCVSREKIVYFQDIEKLAQNSDMVKSNVTFKPNDLLSITVSAADLESVRPFNVIIESRPIVGSSSLFTNNTQQLGYLVDTSGDIHFPVLGTINVEGLTPKELNEYLKEQLLTYIKDPIINIRILNFTVSILGEVSRPGTYTITGEQISLLEALGLAGDLTIYGKRDNILIIRENGGKKSYAYLDFRSSDLLDSEYYYLKQNDVVYVEPNQAQRQGSSFNRNSTVYISIASLMLSVLVLLFR